MSATKLDEVIETVLRAREDGPDALAAMALSFGATMALGTLRIHALRGQIVELRAAQTAADEMVATLRHERDAACAELKAARESATRAEAWRLRTALDECRTARDGAVRERDESQAAHEHTRAQWAAVCRERDEAGAALVTAGKIAAEAVREREAFSLRLSAAERERDEARADRDAALARVQALHAELVATRADFRHQRDITEDALRERDEARAALDLARESAREAREEIAQSLALVDDARAELDAALARPTYEARTVAPTLAERDVHQEAGGAWLVCRIDSDGKLHADVLIGWHGWRWEGYFFVALDARRLPCAWPVPSAEVTP